MVSTITAATGVPGFKTCTGISINVATNILHITGLPGPKVLLKYIFYVHMYSSIHTCSMYTCKVYKCSNNANIHDSYFFHHHH